MNKTRRRGRPRKPARERRTEWIGAAVTRQEKDEFRQRATSGGLTETAYLRQCVGFPEKTAT